MNKLFIALFLATTLTTNAQTFFKDTNDKWGVKDAQGKVLIAGKYNAAGKFENGIAAIKADTPMGELWGVINTTGKEIVPVKYAKIEIGKFGSAKHDVLIKALDFNAVFWTLIDPHTGKDLTQTGRYYAIAPFINGVARVEGKDKTTGVIDETGKEIIDLGFAEQIAASLLGKNATKQVDEQLIALYTKITEDQKNHGARYQSLFETVSQDVLHAGASNALGVLMTQKDAYLKLMNEHKRQAIGLSILPAGDALKTAMINFCNGQEDAVNKTYSMITDFQKGKKPNTYVIEGALTTAERTFNKMVREYKIYTGQIAAPPPAPVAATTIKENEPSKPPFGAPINSNDVFYLKEDFTSTSFKSKAQTAVRTKGNLIGNSGLQFYYNNFNFLYRDSQYVYTNEFDVQKVENIGFAGYHGADIEKAFFTNSQNRQLKLKLKPLTNSKNTYGVALKSSSENDQRKFEMKGPNIPAPPTIAYALLINNNEFKIIKYKGYDVYWNKKENQEVIKKGKLVKNNDGSTFSINKEKSKWDFFIDGNLLHSLTDDTFLHVNENWGELIVDGKSKLQIIEYEFVARKN